MTAVFRYADLDLTFAPHPVTGDVSRLFDIDAVNDAIQNLVQFKKFDKPYHPEIDSQVTDHLGELASSFTSAEIRSAIINVLTNYEPRVSIIDVLVSPDIDNHLYQISIRYGIKNISTPVTLTFPLYLVQ